YARDFDIDRDMEAKQMSLGMRIASLLGALALAASAFFLFYQFWGRFSTASQVSILLCAGAGSFVATWWIQTRDASGYFAKLAAMVAFACFVLNIGMYWLHFGERPENFFPAAVLLFAFPSLLRHARYPDFPAVYRILALLALFLPMIVLANWGEASYLPFDDWAIEAIYQILGFAGTG